MFKVKQKKEKKENPRSSDFEWHSLLLAFLLQSADKLISCRFLSTFSDIQKMACKIYRSSAFFK